MHASDHSIATLVTFGLIFFGAYFLPSLIANGRRHHNTNAITLTNMFFGWTVLGWLICLIWAFTSSNKPMVIYKEAPAPAPAPSPSPIGQQAPSLAWPTLVDPSATHHQQVGKDRPSAHYRPERWAPDRTGLIVLAMVIAAAIGLAIFINLWQSGQDSKSEVPPQAALPSQASSETQFAEYPTNPPSLRGKPTLELGSLILLLMPTQGIALNWNFGASAPIVWSSRGPVRLPNSVTSMKAGYVRVNLLGQAKAAATNPPTEDGWTVTMFSDNTPTSSAYTYIEIEPDCASAIGDGCLFDPMPSLAAAKISVKKLCDEPLYNGLPSATYLLTAPGHAPMLLEKSERHSQTSQYTSLAIRPTSYQSTACKG